MIWRATAKPRTLRTCPLGIFAEKRAAPPLAFSLEEPGKREASAAGEGEEEEEQEEVVIPGIRGLLRASRSRDTTQINLFFLGRGKYRTIIGCLEPKSGGNILSA